MSLVEHLDRAIVTDQTAAAEAYAIADPRVPGIHDPGGRQNAAVGAEVIELTVTGEVRGPFPAVRAVDSLVERYCPAVAHCQVTQHPTNHRPVPSESTGRVL